MAIVACCDVRSDVALAGATRPGCERAFTDYDTMIGEHELDGDAFRLQLEAFAAAARGEGPPVPTLAESVVTAFTVDALLAGSASGVGVEVAVPEVVRT